MTYGGSRRPDLAARLRRGQRVLKSRLERPESVLALLRAAHDSLDPESIGGLVVTRADEWFKAPACGVFAADLDGQVVGLASKGIGRVAVAGGNRRRAMGPGPRAGVRVGRSAEGFASDGRRGRRARLAACGAARKRSAALVVMERQAATQVPQLTPAAGQPLGEHARGAGAGARQRAAVETVGSASR